MRSSTAGRRASARSAFTLIEVLVVAVLLGVLMLLIATHVGPALDAARRSVCAANLRQLQLAFQQYLHDHEDRWFPWRENVPGGVLWYFGFEPSGRRPEGERLIDRSRARLEPYLDQRAGVEICPAMPFGAPYFKQKFSEPTYSYGLNAWMLAGMPAVTQSGIETARGVERPGETITWADAAQINTWQVPASPQNPMLEEWYFLSNERPPVFHFRHGNLLNAAFFDGSVRPMPPYSLDPHGDGQVGFIARPRDQFLLLPVKPSPTR